MQIIVMIIVLSGSYGFTGGAPIIQGFKTIAACERAIPVVKKTYSNVEKIQCLALSQE